ncbi:hypothetical protein V5D56_19720 [Cellulosimicrobium sp. PMB13]|uniref:hypothetical protein n=1 Tax=Cellulosimicrobium sp. PMB13 TaxID=3120158 RepID=UPI003F4C2A0F
MGGGLPLDALVVDQGSDTLVVSFHGALDRKKFSLPRFERCRTIVEAGYSYLGLTDPWLHVNNSLQLSWFTGDVRTDLWPLLADWAATVADRLGVNNLILSGSSGGGFAALQTSALVRGSVALVFNPQTEIYRYVLPNGSVWAQRQYLDAVLPELWPPRLEDLGTDMDWTLPLGDRLSALRRHVRLGGTRVLYATNVKDHHHQQHFEPFARALMSSGRAGSLRVLEYDDGSIHRPPDTDRFIGALGIAVDWARR